MGDSCWDSDVVKMTTAVRQSDSVFTRSTDQINNNF